MGAGASRSIPDAACCKATVSKIAIESCDAGPPQPRLENEEEQGQLQPQESGVDPSELEVKVKLRERSSTASLSALGRHVCRTHSEVDTEIARGISLRRSLANFGRVWRYDPKTWTLEERMSLYQLSKKVPKFQMFISHTWWTPGRWKVLSLSFQCGWHYVLICWFCAIILSAVLCKAGVLPMPFKYQARIFGFNELCPMGFWVLATGFLATVLSLASVSILPHRCHGNDMSFIDVTSIHQVDHMLMERGVYGIAGFLSISSELRILWSSPYLSRLWCVFELAAYKKVNPEGRITFRPLFIERVVAVMMASTYIFGMVFLILRDLLGPGIIMFTFSFAMWVVPYTVGIYLLRMNFREKHQLISQLATFDLENVNCAEQFDREFIYSAIEKWYGSKRAFTHFVRHDLRRELEQRFFATRLPRRYLLLLLTPLFSVETEFFLANWRGGAPFDCLLSFAVGVLIAYDIFFILACSLLMVTLCDVLAPRRFGCLDHLQTLLVILVVVGLLGFGLQVSSQAYQDSVAGAFIFLAISVVFAALMWWLEGKSRCDRKLSDVDHKAHALEVEEEESNP
ncbi:GIP [Symbiodinium natans]|uniref:GIP protein n=1 Tax=Symbiodinium natans TaxID=878477 RepID=A0A812HZ47_9DINO|nr:GIP [Symbiodinium natans]